jgi:hypothetical protein
MKTTETHLNTGTQFICAVLLLWIIIQVTVLVIKLRRQELENINHVITVWYRIVLYVLYFMFQFYWIQIIIIVTTTDLSVT